MDQRTKYGWKYAFEETVITNGRSLKDIIIYLYIHHNEKKKFKVILF